MDTMGRPGSDPDLMEATKESVRNMIRHLTRAYDLTAERGLRTLQRRGRRQGPEIVDRPNWVVGTMISKDIFPD